MSRPSALPRLSGANTPMRGSRESLLSHSNNTDRDWIIGDRCYVNGVKPGKVAFLGETRFGQGEWAGVALDQPTGKNDGMVNGVRYFQCAPNHGVFCRISKLYRKLQQNSDPLERASMSQEKSMSPQTMNENSMMTSSPASTSVVPSIGDTTNVKVGDKIVITGSDKKGVLRFLGHTKFADGTWVGVELDQPTGKNDGSVQGERYFICKPRYGVFVPLAKVAPLVGVPSSESRRTSTISQQGGRPAGLPPIRQTISSTLRMQKNNSSKCGSQESLCSLSSVQSSASRRIRLGVAALNSPVSQTRRDILPSISDTSSHDECNANLSAVKLQRDQLCLTLETTAAELRKLEASYDDEKKRTEDLQFRLEEESIAKSQLESKIAELEQKIEKLSEYDKQKDLNAIKSNGMEIAKDEIDRLTALLEKSRFDCKTFENLYDEEKRRFEDLQFKFEEEMASKKSIENLNADVKPFESKIADLSAEISRLKSENQKLLDSEKLSIDQKSQMDYMQIKLIDFEKNVQENSAALENSEKLLDSTKKEFDELSVKYATLQTDFNALTSKCEELTKNQAKLSQIETLRQLETSDQEKSLALEKSEKLLNLTKEKLEELNVKYANLQADFINSIAKCEALTKIESDYGRLKENLHKLEAENNELKSGLETKESDVERLTKEKENTQILLNDLQNQKVMQETTVEHFLAEKANLEDNLSEKQEILQMIENQLNTTKNELHQSRNSYASLEENFNRLTSKYNDLVKNCSNDAKLKENLHKSESENANLKSQLDSERLALQNLSEEKENLHISLADLQSKLEESKQNFTLEKSKMEEHLSEKQEILQTIENQLNTKKIELQQNQSSHANLEENFAQLTSKYDGLMKNCSNDTKLKENLHKSETENANLKAELDSEKLASQNLHKERESLHSSLIDVQSKMEESERNFKLERSKLEENLSEKQEMLQSIENQLNTSKSELQQNRNSHANLEQNFNELTSKYDEMMKSSANDDAKLKENLHKLEAENANLKVDLDSEKLASQNLNKEKENLQVFLADLRSKHEESEDHLRVQLLNLEELALTKQQMLQTTDNQLAATKIELEQSRVNYANLEQNFNELTSKFDEMMKSSSAGDAKLKENLHKTEVESSNLKTEIESHKSIIKNLQADKENMQILLTDLQTQRDMLEREKENFQAEKLVLASLQCKNSDLEAVVKRLENDKSNLLLKFKELKSANDVIATNFNTAASYSASTPNNASPYSAPMPNNVSNKDSSPYESQVDFLNSVIADLKRQNQELQLKVDIFMQGGVDFGSSSHVIKKLPKPRLFCDICDIFDAHETEDCPKQASSSATETESDHSHYNGERGAQRPYCDGCEMFGHWSNECQNQSY